MRFVPLSLTLVALIAGCDRATDPESLNEVATAPVLDATSKSVDPAALTPAPSQVGATAECRADGRWIICHTELVFDNVDVPDFDIGCGMIYETSHDVRRGIRWYDAADSVIVKRHVTQDLRGTLSLSPDGTGPTVNLTAHDNWYDSGYADPNDLDSGVRSSHGDGIAVQAPGVGVIVHIAGLDTPEGTHRGVFRDFSDPAIAAKLCAALTR